MARTVADLESFCRENGHIGFSFFLGSEGWVVNVRTKSGWLPPAGRFASLEAAIDAAVDPKPPEPARRRSRLL